MFYQNSDFSFLGQVFQYCLLGLKVCLLRIASCSEIRNRVISCPEPQLWNSPTTKEYIAYWKFHVNEILEEEDYTYYENEEDYDFDEEAIHNMDT